MKQLTIAALMIGVLIAAVLVAAAVFAAGWALTTKLLALAGVVLVAFGALAVLAQRDPSQS